MQSLTRRRWLLTFPLALIACGGSEAARDVERVTTTSDVAKTVAPTIASPAPTMSAPDASASSISTATTVVATTAVATTATPVTTTTEATPEPCSIREDGLVELAGGLETIDPASEQFAALGVGPADIASIVCDVFTRMLDEDDPAEIVAELVDRFVPGLAPDTSGPALTYHPAPGAPCDSAFAVGALTGGVDIAFRGPAALEDNYFEVFFVCDG